MKHLCVIQLINSTVRSCGRSLREPVISQCRKGQNQSTVSELFYHTFATDFIIQGAAVPGCPAVGGYRYHQAEANTLPCTRSVQEVCPYERNRTVRFWRGAIRTRDTPSALRAGRRSCQEGNFCTKKQLSSKYTRGKKWKSGDFSALCLCQPECIFTMHAPLWKSAVDKPVENVENSELSTGISVKTHGGQGCGKVCISQCIFCAVLPKYPGYVTVSFSLPGKKSGLKVTKL